jgi:hypothetical protein
MYVLLEYLLARYIIIIAFLFISKMIKISDEKYYLFEILIENHHFVELILNLNYKNDAHPISNV